MVWSANAAFKNLQLQNKTILLGFQKMKQIVKIRVKMFKIQF
ncbi:hypothetical protein EDF67_10194 [Sphingobacterium sp. JUb78]|nr:hypothetical protein [Sphingobacterium kitahiroshimense]TCR13991.1 hypothetical protein EDF67_10194 [Sphingobacterium sp. JUb78]